MKLSKPFYSLFSAFMPISSLCAGIPLAAGLLSLQFTSIAIPYPAVFTLCGISAVAASFYFSFIKNTRVDYAAANVRSIVIVVMLVYAIISLLRFGMPLVDRFLPGFVNVLSTLMAVYVWISVIAMRQVFFDREEFETYIDSYDGEKLQQAMLADAALLAPADSRGAKVRLFYTIQLIIIILLAAAWTVLKSALPVPLLVLLLIHIIGAICFFTVLTLFKQEHYYAGAGISVPSLDRSKGIAGMIVFSLIAAVLALLLASDKSILPISLITGFFLWLFRLLASLSRPPEDVETVMPEMPSFGMSNPAPILPPELMQEYEPSPFWDYVKYAAIAAAIIGFVWFMIKPLFFRSRTNPDKPPLLKRFAGILAEWFKSLRTAFAYFIASLTGTGGAVKMKTPSAADLRRLSGDLLAAYSPAKKRELKMSVTLFARLIHWGNELCGIPWKPSHAPGEYCATLGTAVTKKVTDASGKDNDATPAPSAEERGSNAADTDAAAIANNIIRCGELFEQALYSAQVLSDEQRNEFKGLVEKITAYR